MYYTRLQLNPYFCYSVWTLFRGWLF